MRVEAIASAPPTRLGTRPVRRMQQAPPSPDENPIYLSVVVPVWNGLEQLPETLSRLEAFLTSRPFAAELVLVDDCSSNDVAALLDAFARRCPFARVLHNGANRGKGYSVALGVLAARGLYRIFIDADLAYPPQEMLKILQELERGFDVAIASRVPPNSRRRWSPRASFDSYAFRRQLLSRLFNALVRRLLVPGVYDTQAGLKGFTREAAHLLFSRLTVHRFSFDVEALVIARAHRLRVHQTPVQFRYGDEVTTVRLVRDGLIVLRDLARIRWNGLRGRYV